SFFRYEDEASFAGFIIGTPDSLGRNRILVDHQIVGAALYLQNNLHDVADVYDQVRVTNTFDAVVLTHEAHAQIRIVKPAELAAQHENVIWDNSAVLRESGSSSQANYECSCEQKRFELFEHI